MTSMVTVVISRGSSTAEVVVSTTGRVVRVGCTRNVVVFCSPVTATVRCSDVEVGISSLVDAKVPTAAADVAVSDGSATTVVALALVDDFDAAATVDEREVLTALEVVDTVAVVVLTTGVVTADDTIGADVAVSDGSATTVVALALVDDFDAAATVELGAEVTVEAVVEVAVVAVGSTAVVSVAEVGCCVGAELVDGSTAPSG